MRKRDRLKPKKKRVKRETQHVPIHIVHPLLYDALKKYYARKDDDS